MDTPGVTPATCHVSEIMAILEVLVKIDGGRI